MLLPRPAPTQSGGSGGAPSRGSFAQLVATDPLTANEGDLIFNTTELVLKIWYDGAWVTMGGTADPHPDSDRLLETGDFRLLEDGTSTLLLEG